MIEGSGITDYCTYPDFRLSLNDREKINKYRAKYILGGRKLKIKKGTLGSYANDSSLIKSKYKSKKKYKLLDVVVKNISRFGSYVNSNTYNLYGVGELKFDTLILSRYQYVFNKYYNGEYYIAYANIINYINESNYLTISNLLATYIENEWENEIEALRNNMYIGGYFGVFFNTLFEYNKGNVWKDIMIYLSSFINIIDSYRQEEIVYPAFNLYNITTYNVDENIDRRINITDDNKEHFIEFFGILYDSLDECKYSDEYGRLQYLIYKNENTKFTKDEFIDFMLNDSTDIFTFPMRIIEIIGGMGGIDKQGIRYRDVILYSCMIYATLILTCLGGSVKQTNILDDFDNIKSLKFDTNTLNVFDSSVIQQPIFIDTDIEYSYKYVGENKGDYRVYEQNTYDYVDDNSGDYSYCVSTIFGCRGNSQQPETLAYTENNSGWWEPTSDFVEVGANKGNYSIRTIEINGEDINVFGYGHPRNYARKFRYVSNRQGNYMPYNSSIVEDGYIKNNNGRYKKGTEIYGVSYEGENQGSYKRTLGNLTYKDINLYEKELQEYKEITLQYDIDEFMYIMCIEIFNAFGCELSQEMKDDIKNCIDSNIDDDNNVNYKVIQQYIFELYYNNFFTNYYMYYEFRYLYNIVVTQQIKIAYNDIMVVDLSNLTKLESTNEQTGNETYNIKDGYLIENKGNIYTFGSAFWSPYVHYDIPAHIDTIKTDKKALIYKCPNVDIDENNVCNVDYRKYGIKSLAPFSLSSMKYVKVLNIGNENYNANERLKTISKYAIYNNPQLRKISIYGNLGMVAEIKEENKNNIIFKCNNLIELNLHDNTEYIDLSNVFRYVNGTINIYCDLSETKIIKGKYENCNLNIINNQKNIEKIIDIDDISDKIYGKSIDVNFNLDSGIYNIIGRSTYHSNNGMKICCNRNNGVKIKNIINQQITFHPYTNTNKLNRYKFTVPSPYSSIGDNYYLNEYVEYMSVGAFYLGYVSNKLYINTNKLGSGKYLKGEIAFADNDKRHNYRIHNIYGGTVIITDYYKKIRGLCITTTKLIYNGTEYIDTYGGYGGYGGTYFFDDNGELYKIINTYYSKGLPLDYYELPIKYVKYL